MYSFLLNYSNKETALEFGKTSPEMIKQEFQSLPWPSSPSLYLCICFYPITLLFSTFQFPFFPLDTKFQVLSYMDRIIFTLIPKLLLFRKKNQFT